MGIDIAFLKLLQNIFETSIKLLAFKASRAFSSVREVGMGHISSHANAQLMRSDPDRVTIGPDQISRNPPEIIDRKLDISRYKWP